MYDLGTNRVAVPGQVRLVQGGDQPRAVAAPDQARQGLGVPARPEAIGRRQGIAVDEGFELVPGTLDLAAEDVGADRADALEGLQEAALLGGNVAGALA